jgi:serine/threonine-protein kinase
VVSEYLPGGSVEDRIGKSGRANLIDALRWTRNAADALAHAHSLGVFHRDTKPSNLLLDAAGNAALTDFGVSQDTIARVGGSQTYTALQAPEFSSTGSSEQTEVWMLACLLYRLVCGQYPYPAGAARLQTGATPVRPQDVDPQLPNAIVKVIQRGLELDLNQRHRTVAEFRRELLRCKAVTSFTSASPDAGVIDAWRASTAAGTVLVELARATHGRFQARLRLDRGRGLRQARTAEPRITEGLARRDCRTMMHAVVEGRIASA